MDSYSLVNTKYFCKKCDKQYSKLCAPNSQISCEKCGQRYCQVVKLIRRLNKRRDKKSEKKEEETEEYRMTFNADNQSHNRTDINDRNLVNIYGDASNKRRKVNEEEEKEEEPTLNRNPLPPPQSPPNVAPNRTQNSIPDLLPNISLNLSQDTAQNDGPNATSNQQTRHNPFLFSHLTMMNNNLLSSINSLRTIFGPRPNTRVSQPNSGHNEYIIHTSIIHPNNPGQNVYRVTREFRNSPTVSTSAFSRVVPMPDFDSIFGNIFEDILDHDLFMDNFHSSFRSSNTFLDILNRSFAAAQTPARNPTAKETRDKFANVKITRSHCKVGADGKVEEPSCTICISEIPIDQKGIVLTCGHIFHPDCINPWLDEHNTCPTCRFEFPSESDTGRRRRNQSNRTQAEN